MWDQTGQRIITEFDSSLKWKEHLDRIGRDCLMKQVITTDHKEDEITMAKKKMAHRLKTDHAASIEFCIWGLKKFFQIDYDPN